MRCDKANKFPRRYDLGFLPEFRKMLLIARHQVVRASGIGALHENIVIGVACNFQASRRGHSIDILLDELKQLLA
jgi:hypothetical protein